MDACPPSNDLGSWCELRAHDRIIRYRCSGAGRSVLVLGAPDVSPFWAVLLAGLDGRFRVIAPEAPPEDTDLAAWLASLLEGLGTSTVRVIAGDRFHAPALEISRSEPDQVPCMVLVTDSRPPFVDAHVPVLVLSPREPGEIVGARVRDFLLREGPGASA
jgi:hypothetical protein